MPTNKRPIGPKRVNLNLVILMFGLAIIALILVYRGTHSKFTFFKISIETNIPPPALDSMRVH